ncbi:MAG: hypothetical protein KDA56_15235 [Hyphomonas sp.]|nr:hypothetical protein [Hyphomonas sp.]
MSHAYPLGKTVDAALSKVAPAARTLPEAEALARTLDPELKVVELAIEWLTVSEEAADAMFAPSDALAHGHLQRYEDDKGHPVVAVTWWKLALPGEAAEKPAKPVPKAEPASSEPTDHTDDLYFRRGRTKPSRRRYVDPRQLDLFRQSRKDDEA